jgi:hypothetical protein
MRKDHKKEKAKKKPVASPDSLTKTSKKRDIELTEAELKRVTGGGITDKRKDKIL